MFGCVLHRSDEMYRSLELDAGQRLPAAADCLDRGISLAGVSKAVGCPGLRIGWLASKDAACEWAAAPHALVHRQCTCISTHFSMHPNIQCMFFCEGGTTRP
jgi:aspartate/methionine/tyrosine aminotransferase